MPKPPLPIHQMPIDKISVALIALCCLARPAQAAQVDIRYGPLRHTLPNIATQVIAATNHGPPIKTLSIECGFLDGQKVLAAGEALAENVATGQTVYLEVWGLDAGKANRADCRVADIEP